MTPPDLLLPARGELAPEIQDTAADAMSRRVEDDDFAAWQELKLTRAMEEKTGIRLEDNRKRLNHYRQRRLQRGEEPFQYLDKAIRRRRDAEFRERLPFFNQLFAGPDQFDQAFPEEQRAAVAERFKGAMDPAREKMLTANLMLASELTGEPVEELQKLWPAKRSRLAQQALGAQGPVDDATFYSLAGKKLAGEKADGELAQRIADKVRAAAISTRPLPDALAEAKAMAGDRWKDFETTARSAYAGVLADFDDGELATARELFQRTAKLEGADVEAVAGEGTAFLDYAKADAAGRERILGLLALQAQAEGQDVQGYFKRLAQVFKGPGLLSSGVVSMKARDEAKLIRTLLERGKLPADAADLSTWKLGDFRRAEDATRPVPDTLIQTAKPPATRPMTAQEREMLEGFAGITEGQAAFVQDLQNSGIKVRRFLDENRKGFWNSLDDWSLMAAESVPVMAAAALPYGAGLPLVATAYGEKNLAALRQQAPDADPATLERTAYTAGALEAGIDRLQWFTLGARLPKVQAKLLQWGVPGKLANFTVKAGVITATEGPQEVLQDLTAPAVQDLASALSEDIPGVEWGPVLEKERAALGDIFGVSLIFGIIGATGTTVADVMAAPKLKAALTDREGLALAGFEPATVEAVAKLAETNPAAAAETLKAAVIETPVEKRKANSEAARARIDADPPPTPEEAAIPSIEQDGQGGFLVRYPDGLVDRANSETDALDAVRAWEMDEINRMDVANRTLAREIEATHSANPELAVNTKFTGRTVTMQDWAGDNAARIEQARQRVRIAMRQEFAAGERADDGTAIPDAELPLDAYLILGSSRNFGGAVTRISMEIHKRGNVATVLEEHAEGVAKWVLESGKYSRADMIRGIRETEAALGKQTLPDDLDALGPDGSTQAVVEAFSRLAVANAFGKVQESSLSAKFKALFRALKEAFTAILQLAGEIRGLQLAGQMDQQFEYWLDVAGGVSEQYQQENLRREMESELMAEAFDGIPEIRESIKGRLPHPDTPGILFPGEIRALYDGIRNSPESGGSQSARTRTANEFFLPVGERVDLDEVREALNEKGFGFDTPADMLAAADLSINYGKKQYGIGAGSDQGFLDGETFSAQRLANELIGKIGEEELRIEQPKAKYEDKRQLLFDFSASIVGDRPGNPARPDAGRRVGRLQVLATRFAADLAVNLQVGFVGEIINSPEELVRKAQALRNPQFETFYLLAENDDGKLLDVLAVTSRVPCCAKIFEGSQTMDEGLEAHAEFLRKAGATRYRLLHNHPSGDPTPSDADRRVTFKHADEMQKRGFRMIHHLVINHGKYSIVDPSGNVVPVKRIPDIEAGPDPYAMLPKPFGVNQAQVLNEPSQVIKLARQLELQKKNGADHLTMFLLDARLAVAGTMMGRVQDLRDVTPEQLQDFARENAGANLMIYGQAADRDAAKALLRQLETFNSAGILMEAVIDYGPDYVSGYETGIFRPLKQRFFGGEYADAVRVQEGETFSTVRADSELLKAIDALAASPEAKAQVFSKMRDKVVEVRARMNAERRTAGFSEDDLDPDRFEKLRDLATLEAIAKALPAAIRGELVGSFRPLEELKTTKGRESYMVRLLPRIERALEGYLQDQYRQAIRREMQRGAVKVAESKTRGGKIGAVGHVIFEQAKAAMTMDPETAAAEAEKIQAKIEGGESLTMDQLEELDAKLAAVELFADYQNADSKRLELGLALLKDTYRAGRAAWLETLMERRMLREDRIRILRRGLGLTYMDADGVEKPMLITDSMRAAAKRADEKPVAKFMEGLMSAILSGSQKIRRLGELSTDPAVKLAVTDMEDAFAAAEALETDLNLADNRELAEAMRSILGVKTEYSLAAKLRELSEAKGPAPVEKIEGFKKETVTVPINIVESLLAREVGGFTTESGQVIEMDSHDLEALQEEWDRYQDLQEEDQSKKRVLRFARLIASGKRMTIGKVSQLEGLQLLLTMRQPDQARKLERLGYDAETMAQLEAWLRPEVKALGAWMVEKLRSEQDAVDQLHRQEKGVALRLVENYFPVRNDVSGGDSGGLSLDGGQAQQTGRSVGFIKERVANNAPPAYVNALAVFLAHRAQSNFWKSHVTPMREWGGIVRDERFASAVKVKLGGTYYQALARTMERIEAGGVLGARQVLGFERLVKGLMRNFSLGTLGLRVSTLMVNTTAALNAALEIPARDLVKGMVLAFKRPEAFKDAWNSAVIRRRLAEGSTVEAKLAKSSGPSTRPVLAVFQSLAEKGVAPINVVDTAANLLGAASVWEYTRTAATRAGLTEEQARTRADAAVERMFRRAAQPSSRFSRSEIEMRALDNPISALMSLFISEPRKNAAIAFLAGRELLTGKGTYGKRQAAQQLAVALVVMVALERVVRTFYEALAKAEDDEEDGVFARWWNKLTDGKAWAHAFATSHLRAVPLAGEAWNQVTASALDQKVFDSSPNPLNKVARVAVDAVKDIGEDKTAEDRIEGAVDIVQAFGSALPGGPVFAQAANVVDFAEGVATSNGVDFTAADRAARIKARYAKHSKELDALHGKTTGDDGKTRPDVKAKKDAAKADWLRSALAPLPAGERDKVLESISPSKEVRERLAK